MKIRHFEALRPLCAHCRGHGREATLSLTVVEAEADEDVEAGILACPACGAEYPVIDGLPVLVPDVRRFVQDNLFYLLARRDLPPRLESLLGDAAGPGSGLDSVRQHVSSYVWDHWGDRDDGPAVPVPGNAAPGGVVRLLQAGLARLGPAALAGPVLDIGCGAGRSTIALAGSSGALTLGIDLSVPLARVARRILIANHVDYAVRRNGLFHDRRSFPARIDPEEAALTDIWIADLLALPFPAGTFGHASALNVIDCLPDPRSGLVELARALAPGGSALLAVPFDWAQHVTPIEAWLGGHSQRGPHGGRPEAILDLLLSAGPLDAGGLRKVGGGTEAAWHVRLHDRSLMQYSAYLVAARKDVE
jgi:SAM-dependent methyltransferase/uncharacterized protein YbaR (Trm112 family)